MLTGSSEKQSSDPSSSHIIVVVYMLQCSKNTLFNSYCPSLQRLFSLSVWMLCFSSCLFKGPPPEEPSVLWLVSSHRPEQAPPIAFPHQLYRCFCNLGCAWSVVSLWINTFSVLLCRLDLLCIQKDMEIRLSTTWNLSKKTFVSPCIHLNLRTCTLLLYKNISILFCFWILFGNDTQNQNCNSDLQRKTSRWSVSQLSFVLCLPSPSSLPEDFPLQLRPTGGCGSQLLPVTTVPTCKCRITQMFPGGRR